MLGHAKTLSTFGQRDGCVVSSVMRRRLHRVLQTFPYVSKPE